MAKTTSTPKKAGNSSENRDSKTASKSAITQESGRTLEKTVIFRNENKSINHDLIAARAWEIWQKEGAVTGNELKHWFQAEEELAGK